MPKNIVCDSSCLILLHKINRLVLLQRVFGRIIITPEVLLEFNRPIPTWIDIQSPKSNLHKGLVNILDVGEASVISLAAELDDALLIIDESKGRKVAIQMDLVITGTLGILVTAKRKGVISEVNPVLIEIQKTNFRISKELVDSVLKQVGEN
jgi:predicted nucleic acid-binding protein